MVDRSCDDAGQRGSVPHPFRASAIVIKTAMFLMTAAGYPAGSSSDFWALGLATRGGLHDSRGKGTHPWSRRSARTRRGSDCSPASGPGLPSAVDVGRAYAVSRESGSTGAAWHSRRQSLVCLVLTYVRPRLTQQVTRTVHDRSRVPACISTGPC